MLHFLVRRTIKLIVSLWVILSLGFACLYLLPGDPARIILGPQASAQTVEAFRHSIGLDQTLQEQYLGYVGRTVQLDLGQSIAQHQPVEALLLSRATASLLLMFSAAVVSVIGGVLVPLVLVSAYMTTTMTAMQRVLQIIAFVPPYALAIFLLILFGSGLGLVPIFFDTGNLGSWGLASVALATYPTTLLFRVLVGRISDESVGAYVRRASALGFGRWHCVWREILPNAVPAALSVFANNLSFFVTGAFFVEAVFGIPGLGRLSVQAIADKDISVLAGVFLAYAVFVLIVSLALDLALYTISPQGGSSAI